MSQLTSIVAVAESTATTTASVLSGVVTEDMMSGALDEVIGLLPVAIPVMIGFIGLRKGISFLQGILHAA